MDGFAEVDNPVQFTYAGATGPDKWEILSPNFSMCGKGKQQSPINIVTSQVVVNKKLKPLIRSYGTTNVTLVNNKFNVGVSFPHFSRTGDFLYFYMDELLISNSTF